MTYSDVITLLMTFFILLLTFATTEPERFEKIQVSMFGGAGSTGIAGQKPDGIEKDSWAMRIRHPPLGSVWKVLRCRPWRPIQVEKRCAGDWKDWKQKTTKTWAKRYAVELDINSLVASDGTIFSLGELYAKMFARKMFQLPIMITFETGNDDAQERAVRFAYYIFKEHKIKPGQMGVRQNRSVSGSNVRIVIQHHLVKSQ